MATPRRLAAVLAAVCLSTAAITYLLAPLSTRVARVIASSDIDTALVDGGSRIVFEVPADLDERDRSRVLGNLRSRADFLLTDTGLDYRPAGVGWLDRDHLFLDLGPDSDSTAARVAEILAGQDDETATGEGHRPAGHLEFKVVEPDPTYMEQLTGAVFDDPELASLATELGVSVDRDIWMHDMSGRRSEIPYLVSDSPSAEGIDLLLEETFERRFPHLRPDADHEIATEFVQWDERQVGRWRTHYLRSRAEIDSSDLSDAQVIWDQMTNTPQVQIYFDEEGARAFADLTRRHTGDKIAIILDGTVTSAPTVQSEISGGSAVISLGHSDPETMQNEAWDLAARLLAGAQPVRLLVARVISIPATAVWVIALARATVALGVGLAVLIALLLVLRFTGPPRRAEPPALPRDQRPGPPWLRLLVALAAPLLLLAGYRLILPGVDGEMADSLLGIATLSSTESLSVFALGILPFVSASFLVELVALCVPRWRPLRLGGQPGRLRLGRAVALLTITLAAVQAFFIAVWLESIGRGPMPDLTFGFGAELVFAPGWQFRAVAISSLVAGTVVLLAAGHLISRNGPGNGFAILILSTFVISFVDDQLMLLRYAEIEGSHRQLLVELAACGAIIATTAFALSRRAGGSAGRSGLRIPASGVVPAGWAGLLLFPIGIALLAGVDVGTIYDRLLTVQTETVANLIIIAGFTLLCSYLFSRSYHPSSGELAIATVFSIAFLVGAGLAVVVMARHIEAAIDVFGLILATAIAMDLIGEWRARSRRRDWTAIWPIQRVQYVDDALHTLHERGIDAFARGANLRTLTQFFAPFVPATVFVPDEQAREARAILDGLLLPSTLPTARARGAESSDLA